MGGAKPKRPAEGGAPRQSSSGASDSEFPPLQAKEEGISVSVVRVGESLLPVIPETAFASIRTRLDLKLATLPPSLSLSSRGRLTGTPKGAGWSPPKKTSVPFRT